MASRSKKSFSLLNCLFLSGALFALAWLLWSGLKLIGTEETVASVYTVRASGNETQVRYSYQVNDISFRGEGRIRRPARSVQNGDQIRIRYWRVWPARSRTVDEVKRKEPPRGSPETWSLSDLVFSKAGVVFVVLFAGLGLMLLEGWEARKRRR